METIHTDSPYRAFSAKYSRKPKIEMPSDQSGGGNRRTLEGSDVPEELADPNPNVRHLHTC